MRAKRSTAKTMGQARELRHEPTPAEEKLWAQLRGNRLHGVSFRRQHAIGPYITDFCSPKMKVVIELDGSHHLEQEEYDRERSTYLESLGYKVLRFWNSDVMNKLNTVLTVILATIQKQDEEKWDQTFVKSQDTLAAAAHEARKQMAEGKSTPTEHNLA